MEEINNLTSMPINKSDDKKFNSMTGDYYDGNDGNADIKKSGGKWPSISKRHNEDEGNEDDSQQAEPQPTVSKSTDKNPWPSISGQADDNNFSKHVPIFIEKSKDEQIVYGIVYEPDVVDAQGDKASAEEILKAANDFMENVQTFKIMHKGKPAKVKVLQSFIAPVDYTIAKRKIKKGSWVLVTRILDKKLWEAIKSGKMTGYSMAGSAKIDDED